MKTKHIFFDLDGTLIDSRARLYNLFHELVPNNPLSFDAYWKLKRQGLNQNALLTQYFHYSDKEIEAFKQLWLKKIEEPERLDLDIPFDGAKDLLARLANEHALYLLSARQFPQRTQTQIAHFGWTSYFQALFITEQKQSKASLLRAHFSSNKHDVIIGDSCEDILTGKELGMHTIAVYSGIIGKDILLSYKPDELCRDVRDVTFKIPKFLQIVQI